MTVVTSGLDSSSKLTFSLMLLWGFQTPLLAITRDYILAIFLTWVNDSPVQVVAGAFPAVNRLQVASFSVFLLRNI